jgi:hypothetical protein
VHAARRHFERFSNEFFAAACAVDVCGVDKIQPKFKGLLQRRETGLVISGAETNRASGNVKAAANGPRAKTNFSDL